MVHQKNFVRITLLTMCIKYKRIIFLFLVIMSLVAIKTLFSFNFLEISKFVHCFEMIFNKFYTLTDLPYKHYPYDGT